MPATRMLLALIAASALPFVLVVSFPERLHFVMQPGSYLLFHNVAEFFSIMVSLSVFGVGWYAYEQSRDRHALFLGTAFLAVGLIDFMHGLGNAAMPAFITANSTNKSTQYWIVARLLGAAALLASAFIHPDRPLRWVTRRTLLTAALAVCALTFTAVTFFPSHVPATFVPGTGLTSFKVVSEYGVMCLLGLAFVAYGRRMEATGDRTLVHYMGACAVGIFSEAALASYTTGFDTYNVLGHVYKVVAFFLIYRAAFSAAVTRPYLRLSESNARLRTEIGERERAEGEIRELNADLERRVSERTARLEEADRRKDEFLAVLSHELRNPLAPISNSVHILRHVDPGGDQARRAQDVIERQVEHLTRHVDDLLDVTRIARGKIELRRSRVDLRDVVSRAAEDFRLPIEQRGVALRTVVPAAEVWADADATRITQVVGNLLSNAAKFTRSGDEVTLTLQATGGRAEIRVRDTGAGIDAELLPRVFDAFVQGERTLARSGGGLGLGLALVKGIAELHGGTVSAESAGREKGTEFIVRLPVHPAAETSRPDGRERRGGRRVLVVDDDVDAARALADVVETMGHVAEVAHDGPSALEKARASPPDVVLCDITLPGGMSGYEVAHALRRIAAPMLLVAVTGHVQASDVERAAAAGFHGHLAKPMEVADIERLLR